MAIGRITGPLLKNNLLRQGVDLAFETDLLYLDVINGRIGIKTTTPSTDLDINGTARATDLEVTNQADIATFTISGNTIASSDSIINLTPSGANPVVYQGTIVTGDLQLSTNLIETTGTNTDLVIETTGTGEVNVNANMFVDGNLHATGTITADGNIQIGDSDTDGITFNAEITSNIVPDNPLGVPVYDLGSLGKEWRTTYTHNVVTTDITATSIIGNGIELTLPQGKIWYVAVNGSDTLAGNHENAPFASIKHALTVAQVGDQVFLYPGVYTEIFPLTIPAGVTLRGSGIRASAIQPTAGTIDKDAILLNGETTVEDLSIVGFRFNSVNNTGYALKFATGIITTSRSPYIRNISVITSGSATSPTDPRGYDAGDAGAGAYLDGSVFDPASLDPACLFHSVTFICPAKDTITATNGVRIEWLNSFSYFANKGIYLLSGSTGIHGTGLTRLRIDSKTGTWAVGNTVTYYDTDGTTVLASGTIASIEGNFINLTGKCIGFETLQDRVGKIVYTHGNAKLSATQKKFGFTSLVLDGAGDYISLASQPDLAFPSTVSRIAKTITVNGNAAVSATQSKFGGSSIAFDGTGDYLSLGTSADFGFGTGDFTIEGWFYKPATTTQYLFDTRTTLTENSVAVQSQGNGTLRLSVNGVFVLTSSNAHTNNAWNHLAICRASGVTRFFINGVVSTTTYTDATNYGTTKPLVVGAQYNGTTAFAGYIDDFRVSNTARYTATFTPTTTAFVDDFNTKLLVNGNSTIVDDASYGTATDFTIEGWIYPTAGSAYQTLFDFRSAAIEQAIYLGITPSNQVYLYVNGVVTITTVDAVSLSTWTHIALVRYNDTTKIYINGTQSGSSWADITDYGTTKPLRIGADWSAAYGFTGYIDEVRISKDVARYTANFTAPTIAFVGDNDTVLLLHFTGTPNSTTILDDGVTLQDVRTNVGGFTNTINFANYQDFGSEFRSIGSACIYGVYGVYGDGDGVLAYLVSTNFAYVGSGKVATNDPNDRIEANEVQHYNRAKIYYTSVDNEGNFKVGDAFYVNQKTGEVLFSGQQLSITALGGITFTDGTNTTIITASEITTGNITISGNTIQSNVGDINVTAATGAINLQNNTSISGTLHTSENLTVSGNTTLGDTSADTINFIGSINTSLIPATPATYNLGSNSPDLRWATVYVNTADMNGITVTNNTITTTSTDTDLELIANGSGRIYIPNNDVQLDQNLTVTNDLTVTTGTTYLKNTSVTGTITQTGDIDQTGNFTTSGLTQVTGNITGTGYLQLPVITIQSNTISTTTTNTNLELQANGTGNVVFEGLKIVDNNIQSIVTNSDIVLTPQGTGVVSINSDQSLFLPVGTGAQRPATPSVGMIRYNTDGTGRYEGWTGSYWQQLSGVIDVAGQTYITPELTPGAADNTIRFYTNGSLSASLDSTKLATARIQTNNIDIQNNTISTLVSGTDINILTPGAAGVRIGNLKIQNNTITNVVAGAITNFAQSGTGYVRFGGTGGVVIPVGDTVNDRPGIVEAGMIRFNTILQIVEIYDGVTWGSVAGASGGVSAAEASDIGIVTALLFG